MSTKDDEFQIVKREYVISQFYVRYLEFFFSFSFFTLAVPGESEKINEHHIQRRSQGTVFAREEVRESIRRQNTRMILFPLRRRALFARIVRGEESTTPRDSRAI